MRFRYFVSKKPNLFFVVGSVLALICVALFIRQIQQSTPQQHNKTKSTANAVLAVSAISPQMSSLNTTVIAHGNIMAWQEASIGTEADALRLAEVKVNVGDRVHKGQLLARFSSTTLQAKLDLSLAEQAQADALYREAQADLTRTTQLKSSGALSNQQMQRYYTAAQSAKAQLDAAKAKVKTQQLRLAQSHVLAPDQGVISARTATVGAVLPAGQELFRLIREGRLEWRAEVSSAELSKLKAGQKVRITLSDGSSIQGSVRTLSPVVDTQSRNAMVYVDLIRAGTARAGMFAKGQFELGTVEVMTLPLSAVQLRDGFSYVMRLSRDSKVIQTKVDTGRRSADRIEIKSGLTLADQVVATGAAFLGDGDRVRVIVQHYPAEKTAPTSQSANSGPMK
jgi:RND family efflux transporter MFP subunit